MQCGTDIDGNPVFIGPVNSTDSGEASGRKIAQFTCAEPTPRCFG